MRRAAVLALALTLASSAMPAVAQQKPGTDRAREADRSTRRRLCMHMRRRSAMWAAGRAVTAILFATGSSQMSGRMGGASDSTPTLTGGEEVPGENAWSVPGNTMLTSAQFDAYRSGNLYVNVHSAANPDGEIRAQLKP